MHGKAILRNADGVELASSDAGTIEEQADELTAKIKYGAHYYDALEGFDAYIDVECMGDCRSNIMGAFGMSPSSVLKNFNRDAYEQVALRYITAWIATAIRHQEEDCRLPEHDWRVEVVG